MSDKNKSKPSSNYRSAIDGQYKTEKYAKSHPKTTVKESTKPTKKK